MKNCKRLQHCKIFHRASDKTKPNIVLTYNLTYNSSLKITIKIKKSSRKTLVSRGKLEFKGKLNQLKCLATFILHYGFKLPATRLSTISITFSRMEKQFPLVRPSNMSASISKTQNGLQFNSTVSRRLGKAKTRMEWG